MQRVKNLILATLVLTSIDALASTVITCRVRYQQEVYVPPKPPAYYRGNIIGSVPIPGSGRDGYYKQEWSNTFTIDVKFFSGYELNEHYNRRLYDDKSIIARVNRRSGGYSEIVIKGWFTNLKYLTEEEIRYNSRGQRISYMTGYDKEGRLWEFYY